jgi:hypothetical protein
MGLPHKIFYFLTEFKVVYVPIRSEFHEDKDLVCGFGPKSDSQVVQCLLEILCSNQP